MKSKQKLMGFLGAQGCVTGLVESDYGLVDIANLLYGIRASSIDSAVMEIEAIPRKDRRVRAREGCAKHWPAPCDLFPKGALARSNVKFSQHRARERRPKPKKPIGVVVGVYPPIELAAVGKAEPTIHPPSRCAKCGTPATRWLMLDFGWRGPKDQNTPVCEDHAEDDLRRFDSGVRSVTAWSPS